MPATLYERLGGHSGITRLVTDPVMAMGKNQLDQAVQNEVVAILYSLKGDVVRR